MGSFVSNLKCLLLEPTALTIVVAVTTTSWKTVRIRSYSVRMRENTDQNNSEYRHFLRSEQKQRRWQKISNADCENTFYFLNDSSLKKYIWSFVNTHGGVSISAKLQAFTIKIITPPWMLFTFFKLYKWYQITQSVSFFLSSRNIVPGIIF